jgi:hypothetical protein
MRFYLPFTGAKFSAYFYMAMMIANFLYIIPIATSQSLFAEDSYGKTDLKVHFRNWLVTASGGVRQPCNAV